MAKERTRNKEYAILSTVVISAWYTHPHTLMCMCMCMLMHTAGACAGEERALTASRLVPRHIFLEDNLISGLPLGVFDALTSLE